MGTGDLSELALGWATYNGDHMSAYAVNADVPKTFIRHVVEYCAAQAKDPALSDTLRDIIGTPVSPELLPISGKESDQKTEDIVGPTSSTISTSTICSSTATTPKRSAGLPIRHLRANIPPRTWTSG